ncbi:transmembrane protein [Cystoisospora suis]|uniref:Transmembrane protein n=1 Tax=Cystoisospora suis TaxID=483139 RepID=A0A2C6L5Y9_9APIC|nr:transmembrane protein [Cystoisospora suis]
MKGLLVAPKPSSQGRSPMCFSPARASHNNIKKNRRRQSFGLILHCGVFPATITARLDSSKFSWISCGTRVILSSSTCGVLTVCDKAIHTTRRMSRFSFLTAFLFFLLVHQLPALAVSTRITTSRVKHSPQHQTTFDVVASRGLSPTSRRPSLETPRYVDSQQDRNIELSGTSTVVPAMIQNVHEKEDGSRILRSDEELSKGASGREPNSRDVFAFVGLGGIIRTRKKKHRLSEMTEDELRYAPTTAEEFRAAWRREEQVSEVPFCKDLGFGGLHPEEGAENFCWSRCGRACEGWMFLSQDSKPSWTLVPDARRTKPCLTPANKSHRNILCKAIKKPTSADYVEAVRHEMDIVSADQIPPVSFEGGGFPAQPAMMPMMMGGGEGREMHILPYTGVGAGPYGVGGPYGAAGGLYGAPAIHLMAAVLTCWPVVFLNILM